MDEFHLSTHYNILPTRSCELIKIIAYVCYDVAYMRFHIYVAIRPRTAYFFDVDSHRVSTHHFEWPKSRCARRRLERIALDLRMVLDS